MKAVILAAGKSTRTYPLTLTRPKPLLPIANKPIIQHNLEQLEGIVDEAIIIVGYKGEMIKRFLGEEIANINISYVEQKEQLGTAHALSLVKDVLKGRFLIFGGDDIFFREDILKLKKPSILTAEVENAERFGTVAEKDGFLTNIMEKEISGRALVNTGMYLLDDAIFEFLPDKKSKRGEYELTSAVVELAKTENIEVQKAEKWFPITYPWDLLKANSAVIADMKEKVEGEIEDGVVIKGKLILEEGAVIKSGTRIEGNVVIGKNSKIGPNALLRERGGIAIGSDCKIGFCVEIVNSIVMDNSKIPHLSYVGDSVIGYGCNLGAGTITANLRHDGRNVKSFVKGKLIDTGLRKLGVIIADKCKTGINTSFYPGVKMWPEMWTKPAEIVKKDIIKEPNL